MAKHKPKQGDGDSGKHVSGNDNRCYRSRHLFRSVASAVLFPRLSHRCQYRIRAREWFSGTGLVLVKPSFENMVAIFGALALALGFAFKDYANSLTAGIVTLYELPYRPGDWIKIDGQYGDVRANDTRAAEPITPNGSFGGEGIRALKRQFGCERAVRCCRRLPWRYRCQYPDSDFQ